MTHRDRSRARIRDRSIVAFALALPSFTRVAVCDFAYRNFSSNDGSLAYAGAARATPRDASSDVGVVRLTDNRVKISGACYVKAKQLIAGGFVSEFAFRAHDGIGEDARPGRGGDGFAFVVQNSHARALGGASSSLGYGGIANAIVIEFDTHYDEDARDPYHNHVAVMARGATSPALSSHEHAVGSAVDVPNLADGERHFVRLEYTPRFIAEHARHKSFRASAKILDLMRRDYEHGLGTLRVFVDDLSDPALTVPMNVRAFLDLDHGRAWVGFTASTGRSAQIHDVQSWTFRERLEGYVKSANDEL